MARIFDNLRRYDSVIRNWWVPVLLGVVFFIMGIVVFMHPGESYVALSVTFGIMVVAAGILEIYLGSMMPAQSGRGWVIASGIIQVLLGIIMFFIPAVLLTVLPFVLGFWLMFRGFTTIGMASDMMSYKVKGAGWTLALAILVVITGFLVIFNPVAGGGAIVLWLGISLLVAGITMIVNGLHLMRLGREMKREN